MSCNGQSQETMNPAPNSTAESSSLETSATQTLHDPIPLPISGSSAADALPKSPALRRAIDEAYKRMFDKVDDSPAQDDLADKPRSSLLPSGYEPALFLDDTNLNYDARIAMLLQAQEAFGSSADLALIQDMIVADLVTDQEQQQVGSDRDFAASLQRKYQEHVDDTALAEAAILNLVIQETNAAVDAADIKKPALPTLSEHGNLPLILPASPSSCVICEDQIWVGGYLPPGVEHCTLAALFPECEHEYCTMCLAQWIHTTVTDRTYKFPTVCASRDCCTSLNADTFRDLVADLELGDEIQSRFIVRYLEFEGRAVYCPQHACGALVTVHNPELFDLDENKDVEASVSCPECTKVMCFRCRSASHHPIGCPEFQRMPIADRQPEDLAVLETGRTMRWKRCPHCQALVERTTGCNFMTCLCGQGFCYRCGNAYRSLAPTPRNQHGDPTCECHLFELPPELVDQHLPQGAANDALNVRPEILAGQLVGLHDILAQAAEIMLPQVGRIARFLEGNPWPRARNGRRLAAHGTRELWQKSRSGKPLPSWLATSYNSAWCHYCYARFGSFEELAEHLFTTREHDVFICCHRTFKNRHGLEQHCKQKHDGRPENFEKLWGEE